MSHTAEEIREIVNSINTVHPNLDALIIDILKNRNIDDLTTLWELAHNAARLQGCSDSQRYDGPTVQRIYSILRGMKSEDFWEGLRNPHNDRAFRDSLIERAGDTIDWPRGTNVSKELEAAALPKRRHFVDEEVAQAVRAIRDGNEEYKRLKGEAEKDLSVMTETVGFDDLLKAALKVTELLQIESSIMIESPRLGESIVRPQPGAEPGWAGHYILAAANVQEGLIRRNMAATLAKKEAEAEAATKIIKAASPMSWLRALELTTEQQATIDCLLKKIFEYPIDAFSNANLDDAIIRDLATDGKYRRIHLHPTCYVRFSDLYECLSGLISEKFKQEGTDASVGLRKAHHDLSQTLAVYIMEYIVNSAPSEPYETSRLKGYCKTFEVSIGGLLRGTN